MVWIEFVVTQLWQQMWVVIPLALLASLACRVLRCGPVTRHGIWVVVLLWFVLPPLLPTAPSGRWLREVEEHIGEISSGKPATPVEGYESPCVSDTAGTLTESVVGSCGLTPAPISISEPIVATAPFEVRPGDGPVPAAPERPAPAAVAQPRGSGNAGDERIARFRVLPPARLRSGKTSINHRLRVDPEVVPDPVALVPLAALSDRESTTVGGVPELDAHVVPAEPAGPRPSEIWWRSWVAGALVVRSTLANLPSIPANVWAGGVVLVLCWNALGIVQLRRRLRRGTRPPEWVVHEARQVARGLGLRRLPVIRMVAACIPPMVCCGWQPVLILPGHLWRDLDAVGRRAILCHELAHLRRRDHWIHRLDLLVALVFWWHPVAWWARRRVQDEADNCCDAWVTWLMPRERRAYAEALLKTRVFIEGTNRATPALGVAVLTPGARRLARRLTMVMTQTVRPRQSLRGVVLASAVVAVGWMLTPAMSIAQNASAAATPVPSDTPAMTTTNGTAVGVRDAGTPPPEAPAPPAPLFAAQPPVAWRSGTLPPDAVGEEPAGRTYHLSSGKLELLVALLSRADVPLKIRRQQDGIEVIAAPREHEAVAAFIREIDPPEAGPKAWRDYPLPAGKLDALYELMSREDVPIAAGRGDKVLRAEVTAQQDAILRGFLALIHPEGKFAPTPKARARGQARGFGTGRAPTTPLPSAPPAFPAPPAPPAPPALLAPSVLAPRGMTGEQQVRAEALKAYLETLHKQQKVHEEQSSEHVKLLQQKAAEVEQQTAQIEAQLEELQAALGRVEESAASAGDDSAQQKQLQKQGRQLEKGIRKLEREVERLNRLSDELEQKADEEDARADEIEAQADEVEAQLDELESEDANDEDESADLDPDETGSESGWAAEYAALGNAYANSADLFREYGLSALGNAAYAGVPAIAGFPTQPALFAEAVRAAGPRAAPDVRVKIERATQDIQDQVRRSLIEALRAAQGSAPLDQQNLETLSENISSTVTEAVTEVLQRTLAGLEIEITVRGVGSGASSGDSAGSCRTTQSRAESTGAAHKEHVPLP